MKKSHIPNRSVQELNRRIFLQNVFIFIAIIIAISGVIISSLTRDDLTLGVFKGSQGNNGTMGIKGENGTQGIQGIQGPQGSNSLSSIKSIIVDQFGNGDFITIKEAFENATSGVTIVVMPGMYIEDNPLFLPTGVQLYSFGGDFNVMVTALNPQFTLLNISGGCYIEGFVFVGSTLFNMTCAYYNGNVISTSVIKDTRFENCFIGIHSVNGPGALDLNHVVFDGLKSIFGILIENGGYVIGNELLSVGTESVSQEQFLTVSGTSISGRPSTILATDITILNTKTFFVIKNNGFAVLQSIYCQNIQKGIIVESGLNNILKINGLAIVNATIFDLDIQTTSSAIFITGSLLHENAINNPNAVQLFINYFSLDEGVDTAFNILGQFHVGSARNPSESIFGTGSFNKVDIKVLLNTNLEIGTFTDITTIATTDGTIFTMFNSLSVGETMFIGSTLKFFGIEIIDILQVSLGTGNLIWEYWDGITWSNLMVMSTNGQSPYLSDSNRVFIHNTNYLEEIRFGRLTNWATKLINGFTRFWIRVRISTNPILQRPQNSAIKLHGNSLIIGPEGYIQFFGVSRPIRKLPIDIDIVKPASTNPADIDVFFSQNLDIGRTENSFADGALFRIGFVTGLPRDFDTSFPIKIEIVITQTVTAAGNINIVLRRGYSVDGNLVTDSSISSPVTAPTEISSSFVFVANGILDIQQTLVLEIQLNDIIATGLPGNLVWLSIERNAAPTNLLDTLASAINIVQLNVFYIGWNIGGFGINF